MANKKNKRKKKVNKSSTTTSTINNKKQKLLTSKNKELITNATTTTTTTTTRKPTATTNIQNVRSNGITHGLLYGYEPRRRSRRKAEENNLCCPTFSSVFEQEQHNYNNNNNNNNNNINGSNSNNSGSKSKTTNVNKKKQLKEKRRRTMLSPKTYPRPPAPALCGVEGADAISALLEFDMNDEKGWLSGALMDYIFCIFARKYKKCIFLPTMFAAHDLHRAHMENKIDQLELTDVLGNVVDTQQASRIIFCFNVLNRHWNVVQIVLRPKPELQLFEPMGKPNRKANIHRNGVSARSLPRRTYDWLETTWPMLSLIESIKKIGKSVVNGGGNNNNIYHSNGKTPTSWTQSSVSAVTAQHQLTSFDCGVACLLYAEKLAAGQNRTDVDKWTDQSEITRYRSLLGQTLASTVLKAKTPRK